MNDILSRERIAEIERNAESAPIGPWSPSALLKIKDDYIRDVGDLLRDRDALLDIIRVQLESSGDCRCMGCQRGREALTKTGRLS